MVFCLPLYQPLRLLEEICMLDQISNGRLDIGVGRDISPIGGAFFSINYFIARFAYGDISYSEAARSVNYFKEYVLTGEARWRSALSPLRISPR